MMSDVKPPIKRHAIATNDKIFDMIKWYIGRFGGPPTLREIVSNTNVESMSTVRRHLYQLQARGLITYEPEVARGIRVVGMKHGRYTELIEAARAACDDTFNNGSTIKRLFNALMVIDD